MPCYQSQTKQSQHHWLPSKWICNVFPLSCSNMLFVFGFAPVDRSWRWNGQERSKKPKLNILSDVKQPGLTSPWGPVCHRKAVWYENVFEHCVLEMSTKQCLIILSWFWDDLVILGCLGLARFLAFCDQVVWWRTLSVRVGWHRSDATKTYSVTLTFVIVTLTTATNRKNDLPVLLSGTKP